MSSSWFSFFILAIFGGLSVIECQNYRTFMDKHIIQDDEIINCNNTINVRKLNKVSCRFRNTFIHDTDARKMRSMCSPYKDSTVVSSHGSFKLTDCKLLKGASDCVYSQKATTGVVEVTCEKQHPVHFVKFDETFSPSAGPSWLPCVWKLIILIFLKEVLLNLF